MAFSKAPQVSTYQTKMIALAAEMDSRYSLPNKDVDYVNCFFEAIKNKETQQQSMTLRKRDGCSSILSLASSNVRKIFHWEDIGRVYVALGSDIAVYAFPALTLVTTLVNVFPTTTTGDVEIIDYLYDDGTVKLVVTDGTTLSTIDSANTVVVGTDPDMPVHLPQIVFLDGYIFMVKVNTADLYNSNLNDPLAYTVGDFISSEQLADRVTYVARLNNYIVLFGNDSAEYFWDAANESGSPLQKNDTPVKLVGLAGGLTQLGSKIYFVGDTNHSQRDVFVMEDFKLTPVGNPTVRRFLSGNSVTFNANMLSLAGHEFYVLYTGGLTYVMDVSNNMWSRWTFADLPYFDMTYSSCFKVAGSYYALFTRSGDARLYTFSPTLYQDNGIAISATVTLKNEQFETYNRKQMYRLAVWADRTTGSNPLLVQWSDDDYQTYTTARTIELNQQLPCLYRLGTFRKRAFKLTHSANQPLRIMGMEADINIGQN